MQRPAGTLVFLSSASKSRQVDVWGDPDVFRPSRFVEAGAPTLLSFGSGPHYCLGAAFAHMTLGEVVSGAAVAGLGDTIGPTTSLDDIEWRSVLGRSPVSLAVSL